MAKRDHIQGAMRNHGIVFFVVGLLLLAGITSLPLLNKDEFPQFTIRQAVIAAVYPGATAQEVEEQVTKPLERFLFSYQEINKSRTYSVSEDGICYIFAELRVEVERKDESWSKIRAGLDLFRKTGLPQGVLQVVVVDDFGNTSSMLLAVESAERTPRELEHYAQQLSDRLRTIQTMGNIKILGQNHEEMAVTIDATRLAAYGIDQTTLLGRLALQGFRTTGGSTNGTQLHVETPFLSEYELREQTIYTDPTSGVSIRLGDIADLQRQYGTPDRRVCYREDTAETASSCLIISLEMYPGNNIVAFGEKVEQVLEQSRKDFPPDLKLHCITDQPKVVSHSVLSFLRDLLLSIIVVIAVMLMLFPLQTALVASTSVPVCTAICLGLMYLTGIELNTVTLAALIVVLGMIVDDSVIVIDGYTDLLEKRHSPWYAASVSTRQLFVPMTIATCAISGMFFPMTRIITGPLGEFVQLFPWAVAFALTASIFYAVWAIPYLSFRFIRLRRTEQLNRVERIQDAFFGRLQNGYQRLLKQCFRVPGLTIAFALLMVALGGFLFTRLNVQMMPKAEREVFAVEIHLAEGSTLEETATIADSLARVLCADPRVQSITEFIGQGSPRFHAVYAPNMAKPSYAQFIVNTTGTKATAALLREYGPRYENAFPKAYCRFKQMDYQAVHNPIEIRFSGNDLQQLELMADSMKHLLTGLEELSWIHSDYEEYVPTVRIRLKNEEAGRLGITETALSVYLSSATRGQTVGTVWEDDYNIPIVIYQTGRDTISYSEVENMMVPTALPMVWVPLRQVADIEPCWRHSSIPHRNNIPTVTVGADLRGTASAPAVMKKVKRIVRQLPQQEGVSISYGGLGEINDMVIPQLVWSVIAALTVMFVLLLYHFSNVKISVLSLSMSLLCIFGTCLGLYLFNLDFSITALLGMVSLIGIIVRNAIIMYEYAEHLRKHLHYPAREAAYQAGKRRMRPIFLTSTTTALGVIPMILAHTALWMPMGVVICFGTIFTLPLVVTVLPVVYWKAYEKA
ncbi:MAG: efflux RND transporter permease subunit [Paludibacteraceae bacterium]|nr:efflux RND transporter permease subunit [Paludibacteraceae bacterium]